jgi:hypothetical protein
MKILPYADQSGKGQCPPTPRRIRRLCERLLADDIRWFLDHPQATRRVRPYHPGEDWPDQHTGQHVLVERDGSLIHVQYFNAPTRTIADQLIIARTETGEVIGKYSEGVAS